MKTSAGQQQSTPSAVVLLTIIVAFATLGCLVPQALADSRGHSGLPFGRGNPLADLQRQIDELRSMISGSGEYQTVVHCNAGDKVQEALDNAPKGASRVVITIDGVCPETVHIDQRDDVWLQGGSPGSGLTAGSMGIVLSLRGVHRIEINDLTLTGGNQGMDVRNASSFRSRNLVVRNSVGGGIILSGNSAGELSNLTVESTNWSGIEVHRGAAVSVGGGEIRGNPGFGVFSDGGDVELNGVKVSNNGIGVHITNGGALALLGATTVENSAGFGVNIGHGSSAIMSGPDILITNSGRSAVNIGSGGSVWLQSGARVAGNPNVSGIAVGQSSTLEMMQGAIVENNYSGVDVNSASSALITSGSEVRNNTVNGVSIADTSVVIFNSGGGAPRITGNGSNAIYCQGAPAVAQYWGQDPVISGNGGVTNCPGH